MGWSSINVKNHYTQSSCNQSWFSQPCNWGSWSYRICCCVSGWVVPDILKEHTAPLLKGQVDKEVPPGTLDPTNDAVLHPRRPERLNLTQYNYIKCSNIPQILLHPSSALYALKSCAASWRRNSKSLKCHNSFALWCSCLPKKILLNSVLCCHNLQVFSSLIKIPLTCFIAPSARCHSWQNFTKTKDHTKVQIMSQTCNKQGLKFRTLPRECKVYNEALRILFNLG
jgi:hypothetical protein